VPVYKFCMAYTLHVSQTPVIDCTNTYKQLKYFEETDEPVVCLQKGKGCDQWLAAEHV
jgi:hypothetical protein